MVERLREAIKQQKPFASREAEAFLNLQRTADALMRELVGLLGPADLSAPQYNVLRILRGAGADGLSCGEVGERMVTRDPDITRLLDRLERRGLIARARESRDRRVVRATITPAALAVLADLDGSVNALHRRQLGHLGEQRLAVLIGLLEEAREEGRRESLARTAGVRTHRR